MPVKQLKFPALICHLDTVLGPPANPELNFYYQKRLPPVICDNINLRNSNEDGSAVADLRSLESNILELELIYFE